jgi:hypothetical protein
VGYGEEEVGKGSFDCEGGRHGRGESGWVASRVGVMASHGDEVRSGSLVAIREAEGAACLLHHSTKDGFKGWCNRITRILDLW